MLLFCLLWQRKAWSREGNGDSGETIINTESSSAATTTAHSKVNAAPGANPQPQGKKRKAHTTDFFFKFYFYIQQPHCHVWSLHCYSYFHISGIYGFSSSDSWIFFLV